MDKRAALLIPETAIGSDQQGQFVLIVNAQSAVERRNVRTGSVVDINQRAVFEGLTGNEWVIVEGSNKVKPGQAVTAERKPAAPPGQALQVPAQGQSGQ
jgi:multidrug efflux system membrane fusion protein